MQKKIQRYIPSAFCFTAKLRLALSGVPCCKTKPRESSCATLWQSVCRWCSLAFLGFVVLIFSSGCAHKDIGAEAFSNMSAQQILLDGEKQLAKRNYKDAVKRFEAIDALYPFGAEAEQSQLDIIYAYYKSDEIESAIAAADRYIHLYPQGPHTDYAYYMKGMIGFDRGKRWFQKWHPVSMEQRDLSYMKQAFVDFNDLISLFPNSLYVKDAYERLLSARNYMAQHELNVANFYFKRKAYVAAANRADEVIRHYPGAVQVFEALKIMYKSYQAVGALDQANDTLRIFKLNYPQAKIK